MADLKKLVQEHGFTNVKTLLNSGNVVFETEEMDSDLLKQQMEQTLEKTFGFSIPVLIRTHKQIQEIVDLDPFKSISITPETRFYVTFLSGIPHITREIPYISPDKHFRVLEITQTAVFSAIVISKEIDTTKMMALWEKELGKSITTRNWNTVVKLAQL
jgi:uncharacterized protein (DUF1697 family)